MRWLLPLLALFVSVDASAQKGVRIGIVGDWAASPKLRWSPPVLVSPITIPLTSSSNFAARTMTLTPGQDYIITCTGTIPGDVAVNYGDDIKMIGCKIGGRLIVRYHSGVFHAEGVSLAPPVNEDAFDCGGPTTTTGICRLQNVYSGPVIGCNDLGQGCIHADCIQGAGTMAGFQIDKMTCAFNYQGNFIPGQHAIGYVDASRVNVRDDGPPNSDGNGPSTGYWFADTDQSGSSGGGKAPYPVSCWRCYSKVRTGYTFAVKGYYPQAGTTINGVSVAPTSSDGGLSVCWPAPMQIAGERRKDGTCSTVTSGNPPSGDFVPSTIATSYVSPGYFQ